MEELLVNQMSHQTTLQLNVLPVEYELLMEDLLLEEPILKEL